MKEFTDYFKGGVLIAVLCIASCTKVETQSNMTGGFCGEVVKDFVSITEEKQYITRCYESEEELKAYQYQAVKFYEREKAIALATTQQKLMATEEQ